VPILSTCNIYTWNNIIWYQQYYLHKHRRTVLSAPCGRYAGLNRWPWSCEQQTCPSEGPDCRPGSRSPHPAIGFIFTVEWYVYLTITALISILDVMLWILNGQCSLIWRDTVQNAPFTLKLLLIVVWFCLIRINDCNLTIVYVIYNLISALLESDDSGTVILEGHRQEVLHRPRKWRLCQ